MLQKKFLRWGLVGITVFVFGAQLVPVDRTNPDRHAPPSWPPKVGRIVERACFDCHSHRTEWPWYARIAPMSWLVAYDVNEGREHLNFSAWADLAPADKRHALEEMREVIAERAMPLWYYTPLHPEARLDDAAYARLDTWAQQGQELLGAPGNGTHNHQEHDH